MCIFFTSLSGFYVSYVHAFVKQLFILSSLRIRFAQRCGVHQCVYYLSRPQLKRSRDTLPAGDTDEVHNVERNVRAKM